MDLPAGDWHTEPLTRDIIVSYRVAERLAHERTLFQDAMVLQSVPYGRVLVLDNKTQSSECDERIYHEALVQPAMLMHPDPRRVFIGGGGEGATAREVLAHRSVERAVMVDIDEQVVDFCRRMLPQHHGGAFDDPRLELRFDDARAYLEATDETFDVIVLDFAEPLEGGPAALLYTREFYETVRSRLNDSGIMVTQSGFAGPLDARACFTPVVNTISRVFRNVQCATWFMPSFSGEWSATLASDAALPALGLEEIDRRIAKRLTRPLHFYDGIAHRRLFALPRYLRVALAEEDRVNTDDDPVFVV
jgi:spermidine synthase